MVYNRKNFKTVNDLRFSMLKEKCGDIEINSSPNVDLSTPPPCRRSLKQHVRRVNFQVAIWKKAHIPNPDVPDATEGWGNRNGCLQPLWTENEDELVLPDSVVQDLLQEQTEEDNKADEADENLDDISMFISEEDFKWDDLDYEDI